MVSRLEDDLKWLTFRGLFFPHRQRVRFSDVFGQELEIKLGNLKRWGVTISPGWSRMIQRTWSPGPVVFSWIYPAILILDVVHRFFRMFIQRVNHVKFQCVMDFLMILMVNPPKIGGWKWMIHPGQDAFSSRALWKPQGCFLCHCWSGGESTRRGTAEGTKKSAPVRDGVPSTSINKGINKGTRLWRK